MSATGTATDQMDSRTNSTTGRGGEDGAMSWQDRVLWILAEYEDGNRGAMARTLGLTRQAVSAWTRGTSIPSAEALASMLRAYPDLNPRWLLTGESEPRQAT
jgi:hypothetical protein